MAMTAWSANVSSSVDLLLGERATSCRDMTITPIERHPREHRHVSAGAVALAGLTWEAGIAIAYSRIEPSRPGSWIGPTLGTTSRRATVDASVSEAAMSLQRTLATRPSVAVARPRRHDVVAVATRKMRRIIGVAQPRGVLDEVSSTGWRSIGERAMTLSTSAVAVCCSSASVSSGRLRCSSSSNRRAFSIAITAWSANVSSRAICS